MEKEPIILVMLTCFYQSVFLVGALKFGNVTVFLISDFRKMLVELLVIKFTLLKFVIVSLEESI